MKSGRVEPELHALRQSAEELSRRGRETLTSAHLLAAIVKAGGPAADLLEERRFGLEETLRAARTTVDEVADPIRAALARAHDIAARMGFTQASAVHLLVALLNEPRSAARRALEQAGVDVSRLRTTAMQLGLGLMPGRRAPATRPILAMPAPEVPRAPASARSEAPKSTPPRSRSAVSIPIVPKARVALPKESAPPTASESTPAPAAAAAATTPPTVPKEAAKAPTPAVASSSRFELDPQRFPTLSMLGKNLTLRAARGELDPVVGRDAVIEQALDVLAKREGNNPCLVGVAGVGKTSVVRGLAQRIAAQRDVASLDDKIIIEIPVGELLAGTGVRGALAARLGAMRKEVAASMGRIVLFFDEIHQLFSGEAAEEIGSELKLALARGELPCIGATTLEEYQKAIGQDAALARRFSLVEIDEPSREDAYLVLEALRPRLEAHHRVRYADEALALGVAWSVRYLPGRALPDKAVSILDLAGARTRRRGKPEVIADAVAEVVAELADMPIERLLESDGDRMLQLEEILAERVVGHGPQIRRIARILRRNAAGLGSRRPIGTFLLLGPSGVGKTETAKAIAEILFHCDSAMTRIDLSEYSEAHAVARLIGAPPGYVGHEAGGQLTEAVRRRPYQVILLDELEKAHPDVLTSFLGLFDEGRLTDGRGRTVDFTNTVILMTSNIGSSEVTRVERRVGFGSTESQSSDLDTRVVARAREKLAPELYNRIDEVLVYSPLSRDEVREIARRLLGSVSRTLAAQRGLRLEFSAEVIEHLLDHGGFEPALGARPMKRSIARLIEAPLAEKILAGELPRGAVVLVALEQGELDFDVLESDGTQAAE
ncbi:MAG TPA: ATP-dependent Clp protease ATP-binding subunit [Polyangiaceae bacterium]|nr:ATP-dependent Clp protease ATP-binding subunit [Polyangiaceae bacterium]